MPPTGSSTSCSAASTRRAGRSKTSPVSAAQLGSILDLVAEGTISGKIAKDLFEIVWAEGGDPRAIIGERGMKQVTDISAIAKLVDDIVAANPDKAGEARAKPAMLGWFVGQVMKASGGKANPQATSDLLRKKLGILNRTTDRVLRPRLHALREGWLAEFGDIDSRTFRKSRDVQEKRDRAILLTFFFTTLRLFEVVLSRACAWRQDTVKDASATLHTSIRVCRKYAFHRCFLNFSARGRDAARSHRLDRAADDAQKRRRSARFIEHPRVRTRSRVMRKLFFSSCCSNRNAAPAIPAGADATPPLDLARRAAW